MVISPLGLAERGGDLRQRVPDRREARQAELEERASLERPRDTAPPVCADDRVDDRQPEPDPADRAVAGIVGAGEALEDALGRVRWNSLAGVGDLEHELVTGRARAQLD